MGSSDFAVPALEELNKEYQIDLVITQPDKPNSRGKKVKFLPVKQKALDLGLNVYQPDNISSEESLNYLKSFDPDLFIVCAYGQILKPQILDIPKFGSLNIHGSILPEYRGAAPIHHAIMDKKDETGVTIMLLDKGMDTGPILSTDKINIDDTSTVGEVHDKLANIGAKLLVKTIPSYLNGEIKPQEQNDKKASYADKILKKNTKINWNNPSKDIIRFVNALDPFPSAFTTLEDKNIKLFKPELVLDNSKNIPGTVLKSSQKDGLIIKTSDNAIKFSEIQFPNKRRMTIEDFFKGNKIEENIIFN